MSTYGYISLLPNAPNEATQREALLNSGLSEESIYLEEPSGSTGKRSAYKRMLKRLKSGDRLTIAGIECMGSSYSEIVSRLTVLIREKGVNITVLDMPLLSSTANHRAMDGFVSEVMLELLTYLTQKEREIRRERQAEGIAKAKARGVRFGKPALERPEGYNTIREMWASGDLSARVAARQLEVSHQTFLKWVKSEPCG